jgi:O-antigen ligase
VIATPVAPRDTLSSWCGWLLVGAAVLAPFCAWMGPLAFAVLVAGVGLLALPAVRMTDEDRPALVVLFAALIWAAVSTTWSPFHPKHPQDSTIIKLAFELPLYWSAVCAARRAKPRLARLALRVLAWGFAAVGLVLIAEAALGGAIYRTLHIAFYEPIRPDLADKNVAQSAFVMALLWPLAALGGPARLRPWLAAVMWFGTAAAAARFDADAPLVALVLGPLIGLAVWRWPRGGPKVLAGSMSAFFVLAPGLMWGVKRFGDIEALKAALPLSWSQRVGYWSHAVDWIGDRPLRGWGLDASRMFAPGIQLHPHDDALQIWLELGVIGAVAAAVFWGLTLTRLSRPSRDLVAAATASSLAAYLLFGGVNFGVWQEWWLGLGALVAVLATLHARAATAAQLSTSTPYSE